MAIAKNHFVPSPFQGAIFEWIKNPTPANLALIIEAVAGSGKTTTIVKGTEFVSADEKVLFCAFGKRAVGDLKPKLPANAEASTLNSLGNKAWIKFTGHFVEIDGSKTYKLIDKVFPKGKLPAHIQKALIDSYKRSGQPGLSQYAASFDKPKKIAKSVNDLARLIALAKGAGLVPHLASQKADYTFLMQDTDANWMKFIDVHDLDIARPDIAIELGRRVLARSIAISGDTIDYDDQLYMPVICGARFNQFKWVLVDEAQDLNAIQHEIIRLVSAPGARQIFVGDRFQTIFGFRGSLTDSMDLIKQEFDATELPLSICYRCGKNIVLEAQQHVPHIQPHPDNHDGEVVSFEEYNSSIFGHRDAVICRNTRPLVALAYNLIRGGTPVRILGKDIEHGLVSLAKRMDTENIDELLKRLDVFEKRELEKLNKKGQEGRASTLQDRIETLRVFIANLPEGRRTFQQLTDNINRMFGMDKLKDRQMLVMSTIHKAKGGEWETVFILDKDLMPAKWAKQPWQIEQERNLAYVAVTRAIKKLVYITTDGYREREVSALSEAELFEQVA